MQLLVRSFGRHKFYLLIILSCAYWNLGFGEKRSFIVPHSSAGEFMYYAEIYIALFLLLFTCFIMHDDYEIELALYCGVGVNKLMFSQYISIFIYTFGIALISLLSNTYSPLDKYDQLSYGIYIPDNYKLYIAISLFVTYLFFSATALLIRVLTKNAYASAGIVIFLYYIFKSINELIQAGALPLGRGLFDPFISTYLISDLIPGWPVWILNKIIFGLLGAGALFLCNFLVGKGWLHEAEL